MQIPGPKELILVNTFNPINNGLNLNRSTFVTHKVQLSQYITTLMLRYYERLYNLFSIVCRYHGLKTWSQTFCCPKAKHLLITWRDDFSHVLHSDQCIVTVGPMEFGGFGLCRWFWMPTLTTTFAKEKIFITLMYLSWGTFCDFYDNKSVQTCEFFSRINICTKQ